MNTVRPVHGNSVLQAVPGETPFCPGMAFAVEQFCFFRKNRLDTHEMHRLQSGTHG